MIENGIVKGFKCVECEDTLYSIPSWGYCDNTIACTDPSTLVPFTWVADDFDLKYAWVSVVNGIVKLTKGKLMNKEEMKELIEQVWSDSMSDNGAIWEKSNAILKQARIDYPSVYVSALEELRAN